MTSPGPSFRRLDLDRFRAMFERAVLTHLITSRHAVPPMLTGTGGLIAGITDGTGAEYRGNLAYDLTRTAVAARRRSSGP